MRAGGLNRSKGLNSKIGCVLDIDFRKVDMAADQYFMDQSVYGHKCQAKATAHWTLEGWDFDGDSDYIDCGGDSSLSLNSKLTVEVLAQLIGAGAWAGIAYKGSPTSGISGLSYGVLQWNAQKFKATISDGATHDEVESDTLTLRARYHVAMVMDSDALRFYLGGLQVGTTARIVTPQITAQHFYVGNRWANDVAYFNGLMDKTHVYNFAEYTARILQRAIRSSSN